MKENYTLFINSTNSTNRMGSLQRNYQYYINWNAVLPKPENINQKYLVKFTFKGLVQGSFAEVYTLNIDFGGSNMYDQSTSKSTYLGLLSPIVNNTASAAGSNTVYFYLNAKPTDNSPITIEYPNNSLITVNIVNANISSGTTFNNEYYLTLEFIQI